MSSCAECMKVIGKSSSKIKCSACKKWFHEACVSSDDNLGKWQCKYCIKNLSVNSDNNGSNGTSVPTVEAIYDILIIMREDIKLMKSEQNSREMDLGKSLDLCHQKLDDNARLISNQQKEIDKCLILIKDLTQENVDLKSKLKSLETRVGDAEQYSRRNTVEIIGIPEIKNENVYETVRNVGRALDMDISNDMVDICHRLPKAPNQQYSGIVVKFVRRSDKECIMERRRVKRNLSTRHIGYTDDNIVYVNESLSPEKRKLLSLTRRVRKEKNYEFLWVRNGIIRIRKNQGSQAIVVCNKDDLDNL